MFKNQIRNEYGLVDICPGIPTDREVRVALWYIPTYTTIAMYVWFKNNNPGTFDEVLDRDMANLMEIAFKYGIVGHGYDGYKMFYKTMLIFAKAGAKEFVEREPKFSPTFTKVMTEGIAQLEMALAFCLKDYAMYKVSSYPGIKKKKGECVVGEVYFVDDACIDRIDAYEGEGSLYLRKCVKVESEWGNLEAFVYVWNTKCFKGIRSAEPDGEVGRIFFIRHVNIYLPRFEKIFKLCIKTTNKTLKKL